MIKSPSKYTSLDRLKEIKENYYRTKCGQYEFSDEEIDYLIAEKENKKLEEEHKRLMKQLEQAA